MYSLWSQSWSPYVHMLYCCVSVSRTSPSFFSVYIQCSVRSLSRNAVIPCRIQHNRDSIAKESSYSLTSEVNVSSNYASHHSVSQLLELKPCSTCSLQTKTRGTYSLRNFASSWCASKHNAPVRLHVNKIQQVRQLPSYLFLKLHHLRLTTGIKPLLLPVISQLFSESITIFYPFSPFVSNSWFVVITIIEFRTNLPLTSSTQRCLSCYSFCVI
jgi:hypothetical protein